MPFGPGGMPARGYGRQLLYEVRPVNLSTFSFSAIPQDFWKLYIEWVARGDPAATSVIQYIAFNEDTTAANYRRQHFSAYGLNSTSSSGATDRLIGECTAANSPAGAYGKGRMEIIDYTNPYAHKTIFGQIEHRRDAVSVFQLEAMNTVSWFNTSPIHTIDLSIASGAWVLGTVFRLYAEP